MPLPALGAIALGGASILGGILGGKSQERAAKKASEAQERAAMSGIEEQRRQFDLVQDLLKPYVDVGETALTRQMQLIGLGTPEEQRAQLQLLEESPQFEALTRAGEESILQQAAATGGLRGGNIQGALAQFRPNVLSNLFQQRFNQLGGLSQIGQASAVGTGTAAQQTGAGVSNLLGQIGSAQSGRELALGQARSQMLGGITSGLGSVLGAFGGAPSMGGGSIF